MSIKIFIHAIAFAVVIIPSIQGAALTRASVQAVRPGARLISSKLYPDREVARMWLNSGLPAKSSAAPVLAQPEQWQALRDYRQKTDHLYNVVYSWWIPSIPMMGAWYVAPRVRDIARGLGDLSEQNSDPEFHKELSEDLKKLFSVAYGARAGDTIDASFRLGQSAYRRLKYGDQKPLDREMSDPFFGRGQAPVQEAPVPLSQGQLKELLTDAELLKEQAQEQAVQAGIGQSVVGESISGAAQDSAVSEAAASALQEIGSSVASTILDVINPANWFS